MTVSVLYVDDEPDLLELAQIFLEQQGDFHVGVSTSASAMLRLPLNLTYDIIVSDYQMPEMDGLAFLKGVRERFGDIPFILFTGRGREEVVIEALNNGADFYIQKGGDPAAQFAELTNKIRYAVSRRKAERELCKINDEIKTAYDQITASEEELRGQFEELERSENRIRVSEEKFRTLFEQSHDALILSTRTRALDCNSQALKLFGYDVKDEFLETLPSSLSPRFQPDGKESADSAASHVEKVFREGRDQFTWLHARKDGSTFLAEVLLSAFEMDNQTVLLSSLRDITERNRLDEELRLLKISVDSAYDEVFWMGMDAGIRYVNEAACIKTGYTEEELQKMKIFELDPDFDPARWEWSIADLRKNKKQFFQTRHRRKDGVILDVEISTVYVVRGRDEYAFCFVRDITAKKQAEELLRESEEKYRTLVENANEVIAIVQDWRLVFVNKKGADLLGKTVEEITGKYFIDFIWPEDRERMQERHRDRIAGKQAPDSYDFRVNGAKNRPIWVMNSMTDITWKGRPASLNLMTDISGRKEAEDRLRESEEKFRRLIEGAPDAIYIGVDWKFVFLNRAAVRLFGASSAEQLIGTPFMDLIHPSFHDIIRDRVHQLYDEKAPVPILEEVYLRLDGTEFDAEVSSVPFIFDGMNGAVVFVRDITDRKRAEQERRQSDEKYRYILENLQDAYIQTDRDMNIILVSPSAARVFGYESSDEMLGMPVADFYHNADLRDTIQSTIREKGKVTDFISVVVRNDGSTFWGSINAQFTYNDAGEISGIEAIIRDITERKTMEQAIGEANRKLNLLSSITRHDIVNQLTMLKGYTQLAVMKNSDPVVGDFLTKIERSADGINHQIAFTKTYQELGVQSPSWFRLDALIAATEAPEIQISDTCRNTEIFSDPMIERVFFNLVDNAHRHGGNVTTIAIRCEQAAEDLVIIIEDNGVGIAPEEKEKIFNKGYGKGSGFGLFLAREILAITEITIRETGYSGIGARFEITVPANRWRAIKDQ